MRSAKPLLVASAVLLLSSVIVDAASLEELTEKQGTSESREDEKKYEYVRLTEIAIDYFRSKYNIAEWDEKLRHLTCGEIDPKSSRFFKA